MSDAQYTFGTQRNSYFNGNDLRVTETGTGATITVNEKEGMLAVSVKDNAIFRDAPADVQAASDQLGESRTQQIYDEVQADFWRWTEECAERYDFDGTFQTGRSGGWLAVDGTSGFDAATLIEPDEGEEGDADLRARFLAFAFEVVGAIEEGFRPQFYDDLKSAAAAPVKRHRIYASDRVHETPIADPQSWTGNIETAELRSQLATVAEEAEPGDRTTIIVETYELSRATVNAAAELEKVEWHGPAGDLLDGVPPATVIQRVNEMTDDEDELARALPILAALED